MRTSHDIVQVAMVTEEFTPLCYDLPYVNNNCHNLQACRPNSKYLLPPVAVYLVLADLGQVQAKGLKPVYSQSKSSVGEVASLMPDITLDLRAAGCLAIDGRRWPPIPQPTQA